MSAQGRRKREWAPRLAAKRVSPTGRPEGEQCEARIH
jgi:hypothetical protein